MLAEYARRRARVVEGLSAIPHVRCAEPRGAFYAYPNIGEWMRARGVESTAEVAKRILNQAHVAIVPGQAFGTSEHIRVSYATSMEQIEEGLRRLHKFFST
jgi:aspartate aminotransferase